MVVVNRIFFQRLVEKLTVLIVLDRQPIVLLRHINLLLSSVDHTACQRDMIKRKNHSYAVSCAQIL